MSHQSRRTAVILDVRPLWLEAVDAVIGRLGFEAVCKATSCEQALFAVAELQPDLLVADLAVSSADDGLDCIRRACQAHPKLKTVVLSMTVDAELIDAAFDEGATAYVMKTAHPDDLASAIRQSFDHSVYFARAQRATVVMQPIAAPEPESAALTNREREILKLVAEGHSNAQLARLLWVAEQTVKFHLSNVYRKLGVSNRTEAARWAQVHGLLSTTERPVGTRLTTAA